MSLEIVDRQQLMINFIVEGNQTALVGLNV